MPVDLVPLAASAALVSSRTFTTLEQPKQEWPTFPPDLEHCMSLVKLCHHEMQGIADTTKHALLETIGKGNQIQFVLDLVFRQVEIAIEDLKDLEDNVGANHRGEFHRRVEHSWRKVNIEIDVSCARWRCRAAWLGWSYAMDEIGKWKAYTVAIHEIRTMPNVQSIPALHTKSDGEDGCNATADTTSSATTVDVHSAPAIRKIKATIERAAPRLEDIMTTVQHLEDLEAWIKEAKTTVEDPRTRPDEQTAAQTAIEECNKVHELA